MIPDRVATVLKGFDVSPPVSTGRYRRHFKALFFRPYAIRQGASANTRMLGGTQDRATTRAARHPVQIRKSWGLVTIAQAQGDG